MVGKKIAIIVPYFGEFPKHFPLWLKSCEKNNEFNWIVFTDDNREYDYPVNVNRILISFAEMRQYIEKKLGFEVALTRPYKFCDIRPFYGVIFQDYLQEYTHWGYCDVDLLFGCLRDFITEEMLEEYDKISVLGHLSILKNECSVNEAFRKCDYRAILQDQRSKIFDEVRFEPNINSLLRQNGCKLKTTIPYADIDAQHYSFGLYQYKEGNRAWPLPRKPLVFEYNNGHIFGWEVDKAIVRKKEYAYVHFQKRNIFVTTNSSERYILVPNQIKDYETPTVEMIEKYSKDSVAYTIQNMWKRVKNAWRVRFMR